MPDTLQAENEGGVPQPSGDVGNHPTNLYFQETCEGRWPLKNKILRQEVKKLLPLKEWEITVRVGELQMAQRSVEAILTKNAMKHSKEFMEGMDLVRGVENDLDKSRDIILCTKQMFEKMQQKVVKSSMEILKLSRELKHRQIIKSILVNILKRFHAYSKKIDALILRGEYFDAINLIDIVLEELDKLPKDANMAAIIDIKRKIKNKRQLIEEKTSKGMGDTIENFNPTLYTKCLKTFKVKAGEKSDPRMAGRKQASRTQILYEVCSFSNPSIDATQRI